MNPAFRIEADGGSRGNPGPAAYGTVIYHQGSCVRELGQGLGTTTNNVAEYRGLIAGLEWIAASDLWQPGDDIEVALDSKLVVEQMSGRWKIKHPDMRQLALRARHALPEATITYSWIPRSDNAHADALVNEILDTGDSNYVIDRPAS